MVRKMKKKVAISVVVLTMACSSILCLGQDQESAQEQFSNKAAQVSHQKVTSQAVLKTGQKDDSKKDANFNPKNNVNLSQSEQGVAVQDSVNQKLNSETVGQANDVSDKPSVGDSQMMSPERNPIESTNMGQVNEGDQINSTNQSQMVENNLADTPTLLAMPTASIGTWTVQVYPDWLITITISADGTVTRVDKSSGYDYYAQPQSAYFNGVYDRGNGYYELVGDNGYKQAIMIPGGIGGANIKYTFGFHLEGTSLVPVLWQTGEHSEFDFSSPLGGLGLVKQ